jgi:hypothetical protein
VTTLFLTALAPLLPFAIVGRFQMFQGQWSVAHGSPISLLLPVGSPFPWSYRLAQSFAALGVGAGAIWLTRRSTLSVCLGPMAIVATRLLLDPMFGTYYYFVEWILVSLTNPVSK